MQQPLGNDHPGQSTGPSRPFSPFAASPPQGRPPFSASGPTPSLQTGPPQTASFHTGAVVGSASPNVVAAPVGFNGPNFPPPPPLSKDASGYSGFPRPQFPSAAPGGPPLYGQPFNSQQMPPPPPPISQTPYPPLRSQIPPAQTPSGPIPSIPMGLPQQDRSPIQLKPSMQPPPLGANIPPPATMNYPTAPSSLPDSTHHAPIFAQQQAFQSTVVPQAPPLQLYNLHPHQGGYIQPPPTAPPTAYSSRDQMPYPGAGPPLGGSLQGLVEEFQSLSVASTPGSVDPGIDIKSLPRPLDGHAEPVSVAEAFPMNCDARFLRLTTHAIPNSQSLFARWHLPLGVVIHPLADLPDGEEVPVVNFGNAGIVRCRRCRTYINPYVTFIDGGAKWRCNLCSLLNDVPREYFCSLDGSGKRLDLDYRPELTKGSVDFVASSEYMVRPPMPPVYFFLIDVSLSAVRCGMLEVVAKTIKSCLDKLPGTPRTQIGFITFDSTLHFYNMKSSLTQPQMMVVGDMDDIFAPLPDDLLVNLSDSRGVVDAFLDSLPLMFQENHNIESALGPALKAAFMVMSQLGGKLIIFQTTLPSLGIGRLKLRGDDLRIYGTDKEHTLRVPEDPYYKQMAAEFSKHQIGVDVYAFNDKYCDVASLGTLAKYTGGQLYYYPSFQAALHQENLRSDLSRYLTRVTAWEAVLRIRCGKGVRFTTYHGHFMLRSADLMALPSVDCDKAFAMQLSLEETLLTTQTVYFQVALLYTSSSGERRIRVHTAAAPVVTDLSAMYRNADAGAIISLMSRLAVEKSWSQKLEDARQSVQLRIVKSLKEYRNLYVVQHRLGGRLIFPESLKLLPLYGLALCKSSALRGGYADVTLDERCAAGFNMMILPVERLLKLLYPSLIRIDERFFKPDHDAGDLKDILKPLPLTAASLDPKGLYIFDDGFRFIIWFGSMLMPDVISNVLGIDSSTFYHLTEGTLAEQDNNEVSKKLMKILEKLREKDPPGRQLCHFVRQGEQPREGLLLLSSLIEDQIAGSSGYVDWVLQLFRQTQQNP